jgi:CHAT domain-containing protein
MIATSALRPALIFFALLLALAGPGAAPAAAAGATAPLDNATLVEQAQLAADRGDDASAVGLWEKAAESLRHQGNTNAELSASMSLAEACQAIGQQRRAAQILESALARAEGTGDRSVICRVKARLGAALVLTQEAPRAEELLRAALASAQADHDSALAAAILNDLGNLHVLEEQFPAASQSYAESLGLIAPGDRSGLKARVLVNAAAAASRSGENDKAVDLNKRALEEIQSLDASHAKAFLLLTAGQTERQIVGGGKVTAEATNRALVQAQQFFQEALQVSEAIEDRPMQSYALGSLAELYEQDGQADTALKLSRRAAFAAQEASRPEALFRWEWQAGRLLRKKGDLDGAIAAYRRALQSLQSIRSDVSGGFGNAPGKRNFREAVGPLFYELADALLVQAKAAASPPRQQELLSEARDTVEQLKTAELDDYLCDECVDLQRLKARRIEAIDPRSAVIYLISFPDRTEILLGLASGLQRFTVGVTAGELTAQVREFRHNLETRTTYGYLAQAQQLYEWLIRPVRGALAGRGIDTLVFVPDGALRTVPLAALHDGERFLIEELAVAVVPGLSLIDPKALERREARVLLNGLSKSVQGYLPLDFVTDELRRIDQTYAGQTLLDEAFTLAELQKKMREEQFSIVHIASHGQFNRDVRKTFVLTYDNKLTLNDLEFAIRPSQYRGRPVEMLVLSACQTAAGDDRAALGLAGVAVKAGARSALASLWFVNDQSTSALTTEFYQQLRQKPPLSKARALQAAQVKLLGDRRYRHPCYWSPYLIIGNWL